MPPTIRRTTSIRPIRIWIPPAYTANYALKVTRSDATVDDLTDIAHMIDIEDGVTDLIGTFKFEVWDPNETYRTLWTKNNEVAYYCDYATTATTIRFLGLIEKITARNNKVIVSGRSYAVKFIDQKVTGTFENTDCSDILKTIILQKFPTFDVTQINTSGTLVTVQWQDQPFWDCVRELCRDATYDAYVSASKQFHFFEVGSVENDTEGISFNYNLMDVGDFGYDYSLVRNKVRIYGATQENGIQIMYTVTDPDFDSTTDFPKVETINDDNVLTFDQAKDLGDFWLNKLKDPPLIGEVKGTLLSSIQPGEKIWIGSPENGLNAGRYQTQSYKHKIGGQGLYTTVIIEKSPRNVSHVLKSMIDTSTGLKDMSMNLYDLDNSYNFDFLTDVGTHVLTEITNGVLKLQTGQALGDWTSPSRTATSNITEVRLLMFGQSLTGATVGISVDDGLNYVTVTNFENTTLISNLGTKLRIKVTINDTVTQVDSISVQYKS